eukprot:TRINITY_DN4194_c0_g1_i1.p1 TRINITY_DN4194_c0_g1~~TRINITY_DN4194_c0_g1_i1.p1  ORF type:complete len:281 (-),score=46.21 TRINITY_DN4194_c0_g1_i1:114-956(-)
MAHGNVSDLVFLSLIAIVVQWLAFPGTLFEDVGPIKAQFSSKSSSSVDLKALVQLGAGLLLTLGMAFSGVKWNPINGKMGGLGGLITVGVTAYEIFKNDGNVFVPKFFYAYLAVLFIGTLHIMFFPSNPVVAKVDPDTKNNHGNTSDIVAFGLIACALAILFYPEHLYMDLGPLKAQFTERSAELSFLTKFVGCVMLMWALILSGVKWNPINGKMAGFGGFICCGVVAYTTFKKDGEVFVPRLFYVYAALMFLSALHIFVFPSNPVPKGGAKDEKTKKNA